MCYAQPVHPNGRKILHMESGQRSSEAVTHIVHVFCLKLALKLTGEAISFVFELAADSIHCNTNEGLQRSEDHLHISMWSQSILGEGIDRDHKPGREGTR